MVTDGTRRGKDHTCGISFRAVLSSFPLISPVSSVYNLMCCVMCGYRLCCCPCLCTPFAPSGFHSPSSNFRFYLRTTSIRTKRTAALSTTSGGVAGLRVTSGLLSYLESFSDVVRCPGLVDAVVAAASVVACCCDCAPSIRRARAWPTWNFPLSRPSWHLLKRYRYYLLSLFLPSSRFSREFLR